MSPTPTLIPFTASRVRAGTTGLPAPTPVVVTVEAPDGSFRFAEVLGLAEHRAPDGRRFLNLRVRETGDRR